MNAPDPEFLATLRLAVARLGEQASPPWWPSTFFGPASEAFLAPVFARTMLLARYHGAVAAAARVHDEHVGVGRRAHHLFRLPEDLELALHAALRDAGIAKRTADRVKDAASALDLLRQSGDRPAPADGPVLVGEGTSLHDPAAWRAVASHYARGFEDGRCVYPYFTGLR